MSARAWWLAVVALIVGLAALRLVNLQADPPTYLDLSGGSFADEGPWLHNARNLLKYGTLRTDGWNPMLLSPLTHLFGLASMAIFGVGLAEARISAAVVFLGILIGVAAWPGDRRTGAVMAVLFGSSYIAGMFGRLVLVDNMVLLLAVGTAALICAALRWNRGTWLGLVLAGVMGALCLITKVLVVFLVPAWYAAIAVGTLSGPSRWRKLGLRVAGFSLALGGTWLAYL